MPYQANLNDPKTIDEARQRLINVNVEIERLGSALAERFRFHDDGMPMDPEEHLAWKKRAIAAKTLFHKEQLVLQAWIEGYERDVRAEEEAERHREKTQARLREQELQTERRRLKREMAFESERAHAVELEQTRQWKEEMIQKYGTAKPPAHVFRQQEIELERLRSEKRQQMLALQENSERAKRRKEAHKEWLRKLQMEESIDSLSTDNLLRHAYRLLLRLKLEGRAEITYDEKTLLDVIEQRYLMTESLDNSHG